METTVAFQFSSPQRMQVGEELKYFILMLEYSNEIDGETGTIYVTEGSDFTRGIILSYLGSFINDVTQIWALYSYRRKVLHSIE